MLTREVMKHMQAWIIALVAIFLAAFTPMSCQMAITQIPGFSSGQAMNLATFGARGDKADDDAAAVQTALNTLCSRGGTLTVPNAPFRIGSELSMKGCSTNWKLVGVGPASAFIFLGPDTGLYIADNSLSGEVDQITFGGESARAVYAYHSSNLTFSHDTFSGAGAHQPKDEAAEAGLWLQGGSDITVEESHFTGNGPRDGPTECLSAERHAVVCSRPNTFDFVTNFYFFGNDASRSVIERLRFTGNHVDGSNSTHAVEAFNVNHSIISNNVIDQNGIFDNQTSAAALIGQGYGINIYGNAHVIALPPYNNWVSTERRAGIVTTVMTPGSVVHFNVGQWVCANVPAETREDFSGCFQVTSAIGSGDSHPEFTWNQQGPDEAVSAPQLDIVNANVGDQIVDNFVRNTAGSCIYLQGVIDGKVAGNHVENCAQMMPSETLPQAGIAVLGGTRLIIEGNTVTGAVNRNPRILPGSVYETDGIAVADGHNLTIERNILSSFQHGGVALRTGDGIVVKSNTIVGGGTAGVLVERGSRINNVTVDSNTVRNTSQCGFCTGGSAPNGFGKGFRFDDNVIIGNTSDHPTEYCGLIVAQQYPVELSGNKCYGSIDNAPTVRCGFSVAASQSTVSNNEVTDVSGSAYQDAGINIRWSGNVARHAARTMEKVSVPATNPNHQLCRDLVVN